MDNLNESIPEDITTIEDAAEFFLRDTREGEQYCEACGAEFADAAARFQHVYDNRNDDFSYHGNDRDIEIQCILDEGK